MAYHKLEEARAKRREAVHLREMAKELKVPADRARLIHQAEELEREAHVLEQQAVRGHHD